MKEKLCELCGAPIVECKPAHINNDKTNNKHKQVCQECFRKHKGTKVRFRTYRSPWWKQYENE